MTNNLDEFDQDDTAGFDDPTVPVKGGVMSGLVDAWHSKPLFKLFIVIVAVAAAVIISLNISASKKDGIDNSRFVKAPDLSEAPGGKSSPYFVEQNKQATNQRVDTAMKQGGSAMPTPVGQSLDMGDLGIDKNNGPTQEYKSEAERLRQELRQEQIQNAKQLQKMQSQQQAPKQEREDDSLARAMQSEMSRLMQSWTPKGIATVSGSGGVAAAARDGALSSREIASEQSESVQGAMKTSAKDALNDKILIPAGTVNYGQLLIEANSDVPGPIMAQIVSGPLTGGRAIGEFKVQEDYLVLQFKLVNYKDTDYSVNILALNPNTTLGGMATEIDPRYAKRLLLPAAAAFMTGFSSEMTNDSTTTVSDGVVISTQAGQGAKEGMYKGISSAGDTIGQFLKSEANKTKQLVRLAAGTPMGLFFVSSVHEKSSKAALQSATASGNQLPAGVRGYIDQNGNIVYGQGVTTANQPIYPNTGYETGSTVNTNMYNTGNTGSAYRTGSGNVTITYPANYNK